MSDYILPNSENTFTPIPKAVAFWTMDGGYTQFYSIHCPNKFHRLMMRWFLGIEWTKLDIEEE